MGITDEALRRLDRPGVWRLAWEVRGTGSDRPADIRKARAVIMRWERLTGEKYYGRHSRTLDRIRS